jgi:hypothetical protein
MKKSISAVIAGAILAASIIPAPSFAAAPVPTPPILPPGGGGGGGGGAGGIIGVAAFFVAYDLIRRTTCSGDFLHLGGPGFTTRIKVGDSILAPPKYCIPHKRHRKVLHAKG